MVSLAAVVWNFPLVGRTRMLTEAWLAARQPSVFVQIPSYRTALEKLTGWTRRRDSAPVVRPWPGPPARRWAAYRPAALRRVLRAQARRLRRMLDRVLDWRTAVASVVTPSWAPWLDELPFGAVVYDCIDALAVHVPRPDVAGLLQEWEGELIARCDGAVASAETLASDLRSRRPNLAVTVIRNGVDVERFQERAAAMPRPAGVPCDRPVVGFVGALYRWIDWALIDACAARMPDVHFVLVGPDDGNPAIASLRQRENIRFLGPQPYAYVPSFVQAFDVCWVPFSQDAISLAANPVKIYEYLALGKPVVSTPVADTAVFAGLVRIGESAGRVEELIRDALRDAPDPDARQARRDFAAKNTWQSRAAEYTAFARRLLERTGG